MKGYKRLGSKGLFPPRPRPQSSPFRVLSLLLPQALLDVKGPTLTAHGLLPSRPPIFSSAALREQACPGRDCDAAWHMQAAP